MTETSNFHAWLRALTIAERGLPDGVPEQPAIPRTNFNEELAEFRFRNLKTQTAFEKEEVFNQRLALDGLGNESLFYLFGENEEALAERIEKLPDYLKEIKSAFDQWTRDSDFLKSFIKSSPNNLPAFLPFSAPFIESGMKQFNNRVSEIGRTFESCPFNLKKICEQFLPLLFEHLSLITYRVLLLELNVARVSGKLKGASPEKRFNDFLSSLHSPETVLEITKEYSVMTRRMIESVNDWVNSSVEFLNALCSDWTDICSVFDFDKDELLSKIVTGTTDFHKQGRTVLIIQFSSGKRLVYKPRSLGVDVHFAELLAELNGLGVEPPFRLLKVLNRTNHGWNEFVSASACKTIEEVKNFYRRQGFYLALLYVLEGVDFHFENIIAVGEHPMLVDVEMLFQPRVRTDNEKFINNQISHDAIKGSVLRVGILPQRAFGNGNSEGIDIGGLTGAGNQLSPMEIGVWNGLGRDTAQVTYKRVPLSANNNLVSMSEADIDVRNYLDEFIQGFTFMYNLLLNNRQKLVSENGILRRFENDQIRILFRTSQAYGLLIKDSYHPDVLRDAIDREIMFDRLWLGVAHNSQLTAVINSEKRDLHRGDIPIFNLPVNSKVVEDSYGQQIPDILEYSGFETVENRLEILGEKDLELQKWLIKTSMISLDSGAATDIWTGYRFKDTTIDFNESDFLAEAVKIGDRILHLALPDSAQADWLEFALVNERSWHVLPMGVDLYSGLSGTGLFLAYLGLLTGNDAYTNPAKTIALNIVGRAKGSLENPKSFNAKGVFQDRIGAFDGLTGVVYALTHFGVLWKDSSILNEAELLSLEIGKHNDSDLNFDIVSGMPGCILTLLNLYGINKSDRLLKIAVDCGIHLMNNLTFNGNEIKWTTVHGFSTGFSHGTEGIVSSLLALAAVSKKNIFRETALKILKLVAQSGQNESSAQTRNALLNYTWCHGISGVGLAKLLTTRHEGLNVEPNEIRNFLKDVVDHGFGLNHSLCHGDFGNLDFIIEANKYLIDSDIERTKKRIANGVTNSISENGWLTGVPQAIETTGLMVGISGIGYGLLRLVNPELVPSILSLAPPAR